MPSPRPDTPPPAALGHHWLVSMRGGEKVLEQLAVLLPGAPIYTLVSDPAKWDAWIRQHPVHTSFLDRVPALRHRYKTLLPLFPLAFGNLRVAKGTRLLLSSDAAVAKGMRAPTDCQHVCYCHSPPRYLWELQETYLRQSGGLGAVGKAVFKAVTPYVRGFDQEAAKRVDHFIANSAFVAGRIQRCYGRESTVVHPPAAVQDFSPHRPREDFYLVISALVPYKRIDLAVEAFNRLGKRLVIIGTGSELPHLKRTAKANITFLEAQPFASLKDHYERCRAFIFPGIEDFGITPVEAQAAGAPVIALGQGGALETVLDDRTGLFFSEQTVEHLCAAVERFEGIARNWAPACRAQAEHFTPERFRAEMRACLREVLPADLYDLCVAEV